MVKRSLQLRVVPDDPCDVDFAWYEIIRSELLRKTVGQARAVLDVGCGRGQPLLELSEQVTRGIGVDISEEDIASAENSRRKRRIKNVEFRYANATDLPFALRTFDVVLCLGDVLCYPSLYAQQERVLSEFKRVLKTDGMVVHDCMNWDWEYRSYPPAVTSFKRAPNNAFSFHRVRRTPSGRETSRDYDVLPGTPLYDWLCQQAWPSSPQGANTSLHVLEEKRLPQHWLKFRGVSKYQHYTPGRLKAQYRKAGFRCIEGLAYGQTYDIASKARILHEVTPFHHQLAKAEAELILKLRMGSGPWLFLVARK